ncbi:eCIS core domain-containing protein [Kitasatospora sp. NBC_01266]|uniref:eCIS core domain-containing protein n=1 Tax=Kitasatospora sp. NBC_01266 TaxID=2903572 RepID=UPI002E360D2D|nr:DUF4157 domain-containing protein [Kitasatospora sp. NBC_01266]
MIEEERRGSGGDPAPVRQDAEPVQRSSVHQVLRSAGRPLDGATRHEMESRLGADFSDVRLHTGSTARASAAEVGARAYTSGNHVVIGEGGADRHTLAHELTHVIQQRQGPVAGTDNGAGLRVSDPSDHYEREAEANATRALATPLAADRAGAFGDGVPPPEAGTQVQRTGARRTGAQRTAVQRMPPKRDTDTAEIRGNSPPRRHTRAKSRAENLDLNRPTLEFESSYDGPQEQRMHANQSIGFTQVAKLKNPEGAPQRVSTNYHFWQEVTDSNTQIVEADGPHGQDSERPWAQDGPYRPPYTNPVITDAQNSISFTDDPGFSTNRSMTSGYWLRSYQVSFRWKVARRTGAWNRNLPSWTSPVVTHTLESVFDPENPEASAPITHEAAGDHTWAVDLSAVGDA